MTKLRTEQVGALRSAYVMGLTIWGSARYADVSTTTVVLYFKQFKRAGVLERGKVHRKRRYAPEIDKPPVYTGPDWIG